MQVYKSQVKYIRDIFSPIFRRSQPFLENLEPSRNYHPPTIQSMYPVVFDMQCLVEFYFLKVVNRLPQPVPIVRYLSKLHAEKMKQNKKPNKYKKYSWSSSNRLWSASDNKSIAYVNWWFFVYKKPTAFCSFLKCEFIKKLNFVLPVLPFKRST